MNWILVFIGGGMGSMLRYFIAQQLVQSKHFPWATLVSNVFATALLALLVMYLKYGDKPAWLLPLVGVGFQNTVALTAPKLISSTWPVIPHTTTLLRELHILPPWSQQQITMTVWSLHTASNLQHACKRANQASDRHSFELKKTRATVQANPRQKSWMSKPTNGPLCFMKWVWSPEYERQH